MTDLDILAHHAELMLWANIPRTTNEGLTIGNITYTSDIDGEEGRLYELGVSVLDGPNRLSLTMDRDDPSLYYLGTVVTDAGEKVNVEQENMQPFAAYILSIIQGELTAKAQPTV